MSDVGGMLDELIPYVEAAVRAAVDEAVRRSAAAVPVVGVLAARDGATGNVAVPGQTPLLPCSLGNDALAPGHAVVVLFFPGGTAYAFGPIPAGAG